MVFPAPDNMIFETRMNRSALTRDLRLQSNCKC